MFQTNPVDLRDLLADAARGRLQLPDFQRSYVWNDEAVRQLLVSIAQGFPVGALLTLETGGDVSFKPRLVEGADGSDSPEALLLDGQQRITSLHGALFSDGPVRTKRSDGKIVARYYYLDLTKAASGLVDEAVISVPNDRTIRKNFGRDIETDLSTSELEVAENLYPLNRSFDDSRWWDAWNDHWRSDADRDLRESVRNGVLDNIQRYRMPVIRLDRKNTREAVCTVFEKVNTGGVKLDAFELLTAMFATDKFDLREDWARHEAALETLDETRRLILFGERPNQRIEPRDFLQIASFLQTRDRRAQALAQGKEGRQLPQVSIRHADLLKLDREFYQENSTIVREGFAEAAKFLNGMKIIRAFDLPYAPLRVALAAIFADRSGKVLSQPQSQKLREYVWAISLGETYGSSTETRIARDAVEVLAWLEDDGDTPRALVEATFREERLDQLKMRISSAYKAIHVLLMSAGSRDFVTGEPVDVMTAHQEAMDIHHIFPRSWCEKNGKTQNDYYDCIVNKTALSARSNREIGGEAPSVYLERIEHKYGHSREELDSILRSHLIEPEHLRADDFDAFMEHRRESLCTLISDHLRNPVVREADPEQAFEEAAE